MIGLFFVQLLAPFYNRRTSTFHSRLWPARIKSTDCRFQAVDDVRRKRDIPDEHQQDCTSSCTKRNRDHPWRGPAVCGNVVRPRTLVRPRHLFRYAGILTPLAAVIAGFVVALIAGTRPYLHLVPMSALIIAETGYLYSRGLVDGPIWFEASAGAALILGAGLGAFLWLHLVNPSHRPARAVT